MSAKRILIAQAPIGRGRSGGPLVDGLKRLCVGAARTPNRAILMVKLTLGYDPSNPNPQQASIRAEQQPLEAAAPANWPGALPGELAKSDDFAHFKPQTDIHVLGHGHSAVAKRRIDVRIEVAKLVRTVTLVSSTPQLRLPFTGAYLRAADGETLTASAAPSGPFTVSPFVESDTAQAILKRDAAPRWQGPAMAYRCASGATLAKDDLRHKHKPFDKAMLRSWWALESTGEDTLQSSQSYAHDSWRLDTGYWLRSDAHLRLRGLCHGGGDLDIRLPGIAPWIAAETHHGNYHVPMVIDTLSLDSDRAFITLVWRGQFPLLNDDVEHQVKRVILSLEQDGQPRPLGIVQRDLQRGEFYRAIEASDLDPSDEDPDDDDDDEEDDDEELMLARYEDRGLPPEPTISLEQYAWISADLALKRTSRAACLRHYDLDEDDWLLEERAWLGLMNAAVMAGDHDAPERYVQKVKAAHKQLAAQAQPASSANDEPFTNNSHVGAVPFRGIDS